MVRNAVWCALAAADLTSLRAMTLLVQMFLHLPLKAAPRNLKLSTIGAPLC